MSTFVSVGNATQPFPRLIEAVVRNSHQLPSPVFIQFGSARPDLGSCQGINFLNMEEFERRVNTASLLIFHAGAGCVIHAIRSGRTPVVMARRTEWGEHIDNHQVDFAREMAAAGKIVLCDQAECLVAAATLACERQLSSAVRGVSPPLIELVRNSIRKFTQTASPTCREPTSP